MDRDAIVFYGCMVLGATSCSTYPEPVPSKSHADFCADFARNHAWIREQGAPINVTTEGALAHNASEARRAGCPL